MCGTVYYNFKNKLYYVMSDVQYKSKETPQLIGLLVQIWL